MEMEVARVSTFENRAVDKRPRPCAVVLGGRNETASRIQQALEKGGIGFIDENGGGAGSRERARPKVKEVNSRLKG
jgi:hypothetical protein